MKRIAIIFAVLSMWLVLSFPALLSAQEVASLTGVVTDKTGAVLPDVSVKLVDTKTNGSYETKTNAAGAYTFTKVLPGPGYKLTFTRAGFSTYEVSNIYLAVSSTHTQNAQLEVGTVSQVVEVNVQGAAVSLDTTDTVIGNNFDMRSVHELPIQGRNSPAALLSLQPGVVTANAGGDDPNQSRDGAVTGARTDQGNITLDGLDVNDFRAGFAFATVGNAPVDSIQEFRGETANPLAASGRGSGAQINLVTKSGTNDWHGSAYEYHRNTVMAANDFFNQKNGIPVPKLIRNQFGASLGGPVLKNKLFFFFNYQGQRDAREDSVEATVPLDAFRNGSISYINNNTGCLFTSRLNTTPNCISTLTPAQVAALDPCTNPSNCPAPGADQALLAFLNARYPHANDLTAGDGINTGGFIFNAPVGRSVNDYVTRIDFNVSNSMKLFGRFSIVRDQGGDDRNFSAPIQFPGDPLTHSITDHSWAYVIGHTWTISPTKVNQFTFGETRQVLDFPTTFNPTGTTQYQIMMNDGIGTQGFTRPFSSASSQAALVPVPIFRDDFTYLRGKHNIQIGGTFKPIRDHSQLISDFSQVQMGLGGGLTSLTTALRPANILGTSATARRRWDSAFTFLLGRFGDINSTFNNDKDLNALPQGTGHIRDYRYYETEVYAQDTWRVRSDLTLTYGLRWQYLSVPYEIHGLEVIPDMGFSDFMGPRVTAGVQGTAGPLPIVTYALGGKANHARGFYSPDWKDFAPRLSFAYNPSAKEGFLGRILGDRKTVIRAGAGIVFDHPATSSLNFQQDQFTYVLQNISATSPGFGETPAQALANDPRFQALGTLPALVPPLPATLPFTPDPSGTADGVGLFNYAIDPHLKTPYSETFTFGIQRELPGSFLLDANYFARFGHRLLSQADAGQVVNFKDPTSGQSLSAAFAAISQQLRQDPSGASITPQGFFENQIGGQLAGIGLACTDVDTSCAAFVADNFPALVANGDIGDTVQALQAGVPGLVNFLAPGVGLHPQFATNLYMTNKAYSNYNGLLLTLHKKESHGLQFDFNYTYSHSIDNISAPANQAFGSNGAGGILCDSINLRSCRGDSDFDVRHVISTNAIYELPFGRGKMFARNIPGWANQMFGGWQLSGIMSWRTGLAFQTVTNSFPISFANNVPAVFNGDMSAVKVNVHTDSNGQVQLFADKDRALAAYSFPTGLEAGSRNNLHGPHYSQLDLGLAKHFSITETKGIEFRADAYNALNHVNFSLPGLDTTSDITGPDTFGVITSDAVPRVLQLVLRFDF